MADITTDSDGKITLVLRRSVRMTKIVSDCLANAGNSQCQPKPILHIEFLK